MMMTPALLALEWPIVLCCFNVICLAAIVVFGICHRFTWQYSLQLCLLHWVLGRCASVCACGPPLWVCGPAVEPNWSQGGSSVARLTLSQLAVVALRGCLPVASPDKTLTQKFHLKVSLAAFYLHLDLRQMLKTFPHQAGVGKRNKDWPGHFFYGNFSKWTLRSLYDFGYFSIINIAGNFSPPTRAIFYLWHSISITSRVLLRTLLMCLLWSLHFVASPCAERKTPQLPFGIKVCDLPQLWYFVCSANCYN